jgi:phosphate transport system permease protein
MSALYIRRRIINFVVLGLSIAAMAIGVSVLVWILVTLAQRGMGGIHASVFTQNTPAPGDSGGLINAIVGSLLMTGLAMVAATPLGVLAGTYLAEFGRGARLSSVIRFVNDILLSAPSILIGLFIYEVLVVRMGHFSGWGGVAALAIIAVPVIVRTTEDMMRLVPTRLREAAAALGAPRWKVIVLVAYRAARAGLLTGILLAVARIAGETAPLLFTALNNQFWSLNMNAPIANLPVVIFQFAMSPYHDWQQLAWAGSLLITVTILGLNIIARTVFRTARGQ